MKKRFNWGIVGPGRIAKIFATDLAKIPEAKLLAVGSRSIGRAADFAQEFGVLRYYGSYDELVNDSDVDILYVATPHAFHKENTLMCLQHGKNVLCEKPMAINEGQVREMVDCSRKYDLFLMEAMWTRFLPVIQQVKVWLQEKIIGNVNMLSIDFGFRANWDPQDRLFNPNLAGGALLDVGVYTIAFAYMVYGKQPKEIKACSHIGETGIDEQSAMLFSYDDGGLALLSCSIRTNTINEVWIYGTKGSIHIPTFWNATSATLHIKGKDPIEISEESGYHYEAIEVMACLRDGRTESQRMPLEESIFIAQSMDYIRSSIGLRYPMENCV